MAWKLLSFAACMLIVLSVCTSHEEHSRVLLISLDGFRWDYLHMVNNRGVDTPNFQMLIDSGVTVKGSSVRNVFITKTFPNHYALVTGLFEESHGIVANDFYDPVFDETFSIATMNDIKWWNGTGAQKVEPVWVTNDAEGGEHHVSGVYFWPGSEVKGMQPRYFKSPFDRSIPFSDRVDTVAGWFTQETMPINFGVMYYHEPDETGHQHGPNSTEMVNMIAQLDQDIGHMITVLKEKHIFDELNIILTSDHGMSTMLDNVYLDDYVNSSLYSWFGGSPVANILPKEGYEDEVYTKLKDVEHLIVYKKQDIDPSFHYSDNRRIMPIIVSTVEGYRLCKNRQDCPDELGDHGYNNSLPNMHPIFIARGPAFKKAYKAEPFASVDLYPLLCHLLDIEPRPNNGSFEAIKHIMAGGDNLNITRITLLLSVVFAVLIATLWCIGACRCQRGLVMRSRIDAPWKQVPSDNFPLQGDGAKPLLVGDEEDDGVA